MFKSPSKFFHPADHSAWKKKHRVKFSRRPDEPVKEYPVDKFEEISGMTYLPALAFKNQQTYERVKRLCKTAFEKGRVGERAKWLGSVFGKQIDEHAINDVVIQWTGENMGYGCFAERLIKKGEFIGEYTGLVRPCTIFTGDLNEYCFRYPLYRTLFVVYTIDAKMQANETSFINHSGSPNCEAAATWHGGLYHMVLQAIEDIPKGEQLFFDYGNKKF